MQKLTNDPYKLFYYSDMLSHLLANVDIQCEHDFAIMRVF